MSIKSFVKKYSPDPLFVLMIASYKLAKAPYDSAIRYKRKIRGKKIIREAEQFRSYYQDELSQEILSAREEYLISQDDIIFIKLAFKKGFKFSNHYLYMPNKQRFVLKKSGSEWLFYNEKTPSIQEKYSGVVVIYDREDRKLERVKMFLGVCDALSKYRLLSIGEVFNGAEIAQGELIINAVSGEFNNRRLLRYIHKNNLSKYFVLGMLWYNTENQYFDVLSPVENEIVIDVGAYDGETSLQFLRWGKDKIRKIYAFDFDIENIAKCKEKFRGLDEKITFIEKGTWDKDEVVYLDNSFVGSGSSKVSKSGTIQAQLTTIDSVVKDEPVTFIKMDIEGSELKSLMGAKNTISRNRPRLAICVYHKPEDIVEIPKYLLSLVPEYKFIMRHYSSTFAETVLYAYCE